MQSKRDQVQAHRFMMNRLSAAILQSEPDAPSTPMRRFSLGTFGGAMIAVLLVAGSAMFGVLFHGGSTAYRTPGAIIVLHWPVSSLYTLGIFLGVDLIIAGASWLTAGLAFRRVA